MKTLLALLLPVLIATHAAAPAAASWWRRPPRPRSPTDRITAVEVG